MSEDHKKILKQSLWEVANTLRSSINADEYRSYILGFIFYKYLSERIELFADKLLAASGVRFRDLRPDSPDYKDYMDGLRAEALGSGDFKGQLGYFLEPTELFSVIAERGQAAVQAAERAEQSPNLFAGAPKKDETNFILQDLGTILKNVELSTLGTESEDDFGGLFEDIDLNSAKLGKEPDDRNLVIATIFGALSKINFELENTQIDVLGDAYEYLIGQFASGAGKKAGEFYTPQEVSKVLAKLVTTNKTKLKSVYDPTCGSGSLLLRVAKEVKTVARFYGQEQNRTSFNLARMNMILHGVHHSQFDIRQEDTLERPQHDLSLQFEAIVANPPFSAQWSAHQKFASDERFSQYGKLAPSSKADFAFVQHMVHHLADNGAMAVVLPHGVLFRGAAEQHIRRYLIQNKNYLDAVIGLPANIFYGTSIPTCVLVFKKCRENPNDILFIDASNDFEKVKTQNILRDEHINKIIDTYRQRQDIDKYSKKASLADIAANDYNLNIPRYIDTFQQEETIDIDAIAQQIKAIDDEIQQIDSDIDGFCKQLFG